MKRIIIILNLGCFMFFFIVLVVVLCKTSGKSSDAGTMIPSDVNFGRSCGWSPGSEFTSNRLFGCHENLLFVARLTRHCHVTSCYPLVNT